MGFKISKKKIKKYIKSRAKKSSSRSSRKPSRPPSRRPSSRPSPRPPSRPTPRPPSIPRISIPKKISDSDRKKLSSYVKSKVSPAPRPSSSTPRARFQEKVQAIKNSLPKNTNLKKAYAAFQNADSKTQGKILASFYSPKSTYGTKKGSLTSQIKKLIKKSSSKSKQEKKEQKEAKQIEKRQEKRFSDIGKETKKIKKAKISEIKVSKPKPYTTNDLPDRPGKPKLPNVTFDSPVTSSKIKNPSGLGGSINKYSAGTPGSTTLRKNYPSAPLSGYNASKSLKDFKKNIKRKAGK